MRAFRLAAGLIVFGEALASPIGPTFEVAPSIAQPPPGTKPGDFRRSYRPFENWTLICDEDLAKDVRICNIRQDIMVSGAGVIMSWSMAATVDGAERMVVTAPAALGAGGEIVFTFDGGSTYIAEVHCNTTACSTTVPVGPKINKHIADGLDIKVNFQAPPVGNVEFYAPMKGLSEALKVVGR